MVNVGLKPTENFALPALKPEKMEPIMEIVVGPVGRYKLYYQVSAAVQIWLPGRGIRWGMTPIAVRGISFYQAFYVFYVGGNSAFAT